MKRLLLILLLTLTGIGSIAQTFKQFSGQENFLAELQTQLVERAVGDAKKEHKELLDKFTEMWVELNSFSPAQKERIYKTCNQLLDSKLKVLPDVRDYIKTVIDVVESGQGEGRFNEWHETVDLVIRERTARKDFPEYMRFSGRLFRENVLYSSGSVEWVSDNNAFRFEIEKDRPKLVVPKLNLECRAKGSNAVIFATGGVLYPIEGIWVGKNGTVTWERAGLDPNKVYAIINDYDIRMKFANFDMDSVTFYNTDYFSEPLLGKLLDKVQAEVNEDRTSFPQFVSYSQRLKITNIDKNVDYEGGFTQKGSRFIASGTEEHPAYLVFYLDKKPFLEVNSLGFNITEDKITAAEAGIKFYLHEDSITHPGLDFKFFRKEREVNLFRLEEGLQKAPYFNSYHRLDIYAELVSWNIDQPKIFFTTIPNSQDNRAFFESDYYFRENRFDQMMGLSMDHPMVILKNCFKSMGQEVITDVDVGKCLRLSPTDIQVLLLTYTTMGFVKYDPNTGKVSATERLYHYIAAKSELEDYDVIQIASDIGRIENASLDLVDEVFTMKINGISNITLSDSHNVVLFPENGTITMKKNRDFDFSGVIKAGRLEFFGSNYQFFYDNFKIEMPNVDSVRMTVATGQDTRTGRPKIARVKTVIEDVNGTLEIDKPTNKSGLKPYKQYPIFTSHENSYAYYDRGRVQNGAYHRENFFFELDPFVFDSLDNFGNEQIQFEGTFQSADIFPEFREKLTLQEDNSLGFIRETPAEGYDIYRGKGRYYQKIKLSHEGLRGDGKLKYLTSTTQSEDFLFLPEMMTTKAKSFVVEEQMAGVQYPPVTGTNIKQVWKPYDDNLHCESTVDPFVMYDGSTLTGNLDLTPKELVGGGLFAFERAELESRTFHFQFSEFTCDTGDFRLKSDVSSFEGFQFKTNNVNAKIDFVKRKGDFISNDGTSMMEFPVNQYVAFMDRFTWYMDEEAIELSGGTTTQKTGAGGSMQFEGSRFISVHPNQDSLEFYSPAARYDLRNNIIQAKQVQFIQVADALVYPDSGLVTVEKRAKMKTLTNCAIVANAITKYHRVDSATVDVFARREYVGTGLYTYKDAAGNKQVVRFSTIGVDSTAQTYAKGRIAEERAFSLSPHFQYKGEVQLFASTKDLTFAGYTRINHQCEASLPTSWFSFNSAIDPEDIYIPIDKVTVNEEGEQLTSSLVLDPDTGSLYSTFLSKKLDDDDIDLLPADGYLTYEEGSGEYRISNMNKLTQQSLPGQYLSLDAADCVIYGEGRMGFGINTGQVSLTTVGNARHDLKTQKMTMDVMLLIDFFFDDKLIDDMGKIMAENALGEPTDFERETYQRGLRELIGADEADRLISTVTLTGEFKKYPEQLEKRMFLTEVKMRWNPETDSYQSEGKIGIGNIGKRQVNVKVNGQIEVVTGRIPEINIYLEADDATWYYFKYSRNVMQAISSLDEFNTAITELKTDKRKLKVERGQAPYSFMLSSKRRKDDFLGKF